jgi:hypothetical protein
MISWNKHRQSVLNSIYEYWNTHTLGFQYVIDPSIQVGSREFFAHIQPWMNPYKFPWIMERIEREAAILKGKHLLKLDVVWVMTVWNS